MPSVPQMTLPDEMDALVTRLARRRAEPSATGLLPRARENPISMRSTQPIIDCRLEPIRPEPDDAEAQRVRLRDQRAMLAGARALEHDLEKLGISLGSCMAGTPIVTLSGCLKIVKSVMDAYTNALWAEEHR